MKLYLIIFLFIVILLIFIVIMPMVGQSQEIYEVSAEGTCKEFRTTISARDLGPGCWDVKLEVPGKVYDGLAKEWKSSFYYIQNAVCDPETGVTVDIKLDTAETEILAAAKLRQNSRVIEKEFTIRQSCPQPLSGYWTITVAVIIILIFGYTLTWWSRQGHPGKLPVF